MLNLQKFPPDSLALLFHGVYGGINLPGAYEFFFYLLASLGVRGPGNLHYEISKG